MIIPITIVLSTIILCVLMLIRNKVVFTRRMQWNDLVHKFLKNKLNEGISEYKKLPSYNGIYNLIGSYDRMCFRFNCWKLRDFLPKDNKLVNEILSKE